MRKPKEYEQFTSFPLGYRLKIEGVLLKHNPYRKQGSIKKNAPFLLINLTLWNDE